MLVVNLLEDMVIMVASLIMVVIQIMEGILIKEDILIVEDNLKLISYIPYYYGLAGYAGY